MSTPNVPIRHRQSVRPPHQFYHPRQPRLNPWVVRLPILFVTGVILLFLVMTMLIAGYEFMNQDQIYPGVSTVLDVDLTGMTRQEAIVTLSDSFTYDEDAIFTFRYGDQVWEYTAGEMGVSLDVAATVDAAYNAGRSGSRIENLIDQVKMWTEGYPVTPVITYNQSVAEHLLAEIATNYINRAVIDATLTIRDGHAVAPPSQIGRTVDVPATLSVLRQEILALSARSEINLVINETPPMVWEADEAAARINLALSGPVEFYMRPEDQDNRQRGPWVASVPSLEEMLIVGRTSYDDGTAGYEVQVSLDQPREFLEELAPDLSIQPANARFIFNDETRTLTVLQNSVDGRVLDVDATVAQFEAALFTDIAANRRVPLVFRDLSPTVPDTAKAQELGIAELVIQKTTYYHGSTAARRKNIEVATANFHGLVIPPYSSFSFNEWLGDVSVETGYEQGLIIVGNQTITGVGGGVCQVATTAFQTAFYGGYPIEERVEHAYRVGYYEEGEGAGMDATVYSPLVDFRFTNDTPYHLLIETYVNQANSTLTWKFYSTKMGRRVVKEGPITRNVTPAPSPIYRANPQLTLGQIKQVDYATSGADVYVYRTVYEGDQIIIDREEYHSHYVPWADQYEVAPGDSRING